MKTLHILTALGLTVGACTPMDSAADSYDSKYRWPCLNSGEQIQVAARDPGRVTYVVPVVDFDSQLTAPTTVPGATLTICTSAACDAPFTDWQRLQGPAEYVWVLSLPYSLSNAVLRFSAPGYIPMDYVLGGPMIGAPTGELTVKGIGIPLVKETTLTALYNQVGLSGVDLTRGVFAARVLDCSGERAASSTVTTSVGNVTGSIPFALSNNNLATPTTLETDSRGVAGFMNLPPQTLDVVGWSSTGLQIGDVTTMPIRAGAITLAELRPGLELWGQ